MSESTHGEAASAPGGDVRPNADRGFSAPSGPRPLDSAIESHHEQTLNRRWKIHFGGHVQGLRLIPPAHICQIEPGRQLTVERYLNAYDELNARGPELWEAVDLDDADIVVFPHPYYRAPDRAEATAHAAKEAGLPCVFFEHGDNSQPAHPPYGYVFRTSIFANQRGPREHAMAAHCDDMLANIADLPIREMSERPTVGFCGNTGNRMLEVVYSLAGKTANVTGTRLRRRIMKVLDRSKAVDTSFVFRDRWWGGALKRHRCDVEAQRQLRAEYIDNLLSTDYTLCVRGAGNYSFRFYETLSACRIPVLINTDCVLPFDHEIDWSRHCLIIEEEDIPRSGELIAEFHASLSAEQFEDLQRSNRALWVSRLRALALYQGALAMAAGNESQQHIPAPNLNPLPASAADRNGR